MSGPTRWAGISARAKLPRPRSAGWPPLTREQSERIAKALDGLDRPDMALMERMRGQFTGDRYGTMIAARLDDLQWTGRSDSQPLLLRQLDRLLALPDGKFQARKPTWRVDRQLDYRTRKEAPMKNPEYGPRTLPAPRWVVQETADHLRRSPWVTGPWMFVNTAKNAPRGPNYTYLSYGHGTYRNWFKTAAELAGVELPPGQLTHAQRHSRINQLNIGLRPFLRMRRAGMSIRKPSRSEKALLSAVQYLYSVTSPSATT